MMAHAMAYSISLCNIMRQWSVVEKVTTYMQLSVCLAADKRQTGRQTNMVGRDDCYTAELSSVSTATGRRIPQHLADANCSVAAFLIKCI